MTAKNPLLKEPFLLCLVAVIVLAALNIFRKFPMMMGNVKGQKITEISTKPKNILPVLVTPRDSLVKALPDTGICADSYIGLEPFFAAVSTIDKDNSLIHIAYFGDSMIEGDLVTHPLRRKFQNRFGGNGIGFIPVTTPQPGFRNTIRQQFSDEWQVYSFVKPGLKEGFYPGLSGYVFGSSQNAEVSFRSETVYGKFHHVEMVYSTVNDAGIMLQADTVKKEIQLPASGEVSAFPLPLDSSCNNLSVKFLSSKTSIVYGMNFENGKGVYVDNYAFRGNSGLPLNQIPVALFSRLNKIMHNRLIILHFGLNVFTPGVTDYNWYAKGMENVIRHVRAASGDIPILLISMPDRAALIDGEYATPAELPEFIRMQKKIAENQNIAFFCLFSEMGGVNSMKSWVEGKNKLAGEDYTHPNGVGASKIADMIYQYLIKGYDAYMQKQSEQPVKPAFIP